MEEALAHARSLAAPHNLSYAPACEIDLAFLATAPEDLQHFGCEPSYDAYTKEMKTPAVDARTHPWRYAGGHMHISLPIEVVMASGSPYKWMLDLEGITKFIR